MQKLKEDTLTLEKTTPDLFFPTYKNWCEQRKFPVLLPENMEEVYVCYSQRTPLYCCFAWTTKSKMCMIGFPIGNPSIPYRFRKGALPYLFKKLSEDLKERGFTKIWTTSGTERVEEALIAEKFILADPNVNVYIKTL